MNYSQNFLYGIQDTNTLLDVLNITKSDFCTAMNKPYDIYFKDMKNKKRLIEEPNNNLKTIQKILLKHLQSISLPNYCYGLSKKHGTIDNAKAHLNRRESLNFDISHYYTNTKSIYVEEFFKNKLKISGEALREILNITTCNNHLPTGAPTSPILAFLSHQDVFDRIYKKMMQNEITMTLYFDDISFSANKHLGTWIYKFNQKALKQHGLWIKRSKIKHFNYKGGWCTGVFISQSGKLLIPHRLHHKVIKELQSVQIEKIDDKKIKKILGLISYIEQVHPRAFAITKRNLRKRMKNIQQDV